MVVKHILGIRDIISEARDRAATMLNPQANAEIRALKAGTARLQESFADLERRAREDQTWRTITSNQRSEFSLDGVKRNADICRLLSVADPLAKRGLAVRAGYVFGQGMGITAKAGKDAAQDINEVVQRFWDDPKNRASFTGHQAQHRLEHAQSTDGNILFALFTEPRTGRVIVRTIPLNEITDVITSPEDSQDVWFYKRTWTDRGVINGAVVSTRKEALYPALGYRPKVKQGSIGGVPVEWFAPIYHQAAGNPDGWRWGVPDLYAAVPWVRAYKTYLEDWARLMRALARISHRVTGKNNKAVMEARAALQAASLSPTPGVIGTTDATVEAMPKTGATIDAESGKPLAAMIAAGIGIPVTMLLADPGQTGARAVAETLDRPMELEMTGRRELWTETYRAILNHVIDAAVLAPQGPLKGTLTTAYDGQQTIELAGDTPRTLVFHWDDLTKTSTKDLLESIETANSMGVIPYEQIALLTLRALGVRDPDEIIDSMRDDTGTFIPANASLGEALINAAYRGGNP